jgi:hypothetical protein
MPIYDSDMPYYFDSAFDSSSTGYTNIDPALRPDGLPPLANCFMDLEGDFVMPLIKCMGGTFFDRVEFKGEVVIDSATFIGAGGSATINEIKTTVGDPGTNEALVTEAGIRAALDVLESRLDGLDQTVLSLAGRIQVLEQG